MADESNVLDGLFPVHIVRPWGRRDSSKAGRDCVSGG